MRVVNVLLFLLSSIVHGWQVNCGGCLFKGGGLGGGMLIKVGSCSADCLALDLRQRGISSLGAGVFNGLQSVAEIDLGANLISGNLAAGTFSNLPNLKRICLVNNQLSGLAPRSFTNLPALETLSLTENQISLLSSGAMSSLPKLHTLSLGSNMLDSLDPGVFRNLTALQLLYLNSNKISTLGAGTFSNLPKLQRLYLNHNEISRLGEGAFNDLTAHFWISPALYELNLGHNQLISCEPGAFSELTELRVLDVSNNRLTFIDKDALPAGGRVEINLEGNFGLRCAQPNAGSCSFCDNTTHYVTIAAGTHLDVMCKDRIIVLRDSPK